MTPVTSVGMANGRSTTRRQQRAAREPVADQDVGEQRARTRALITAVSGGGDRA